MKFERKDVKTNDIIFKVRTTLKEWATTNITSDEYKFILMRESIEDYESYQPDNGMHQYMISEYDQFIEALIPYPEEEKFKYTDEWQDTTEREVKTQQPVTGKKRKTTKN